MFCKKNAAFVTPPQPKWPPRNISFGCSSSSLPGMTRGSDSCRRKQWRAFHSFGWPESLSNCSAKCGYLNAIGKKKPFWMNISDISISGLAARVRRGCLNTFSPHFKSRRNDNRCQLNQENLNGFHKFSDFGRKDLWLAGGTVPPQHQLNSSSCDHLLFCALHCGKSLYITEAQVSISLVWVYFPPIFPVWKTHQKMSSDVFVLRA